MSTTTRAHHRLLALALAGLLLFLTQVGVGAAPANALGASPTGLRAVDVTTSGIGLTWDAGGQTAFRIQMSSQADMSDAVSWRVFGNYYAWTRLNPNPDKTSQRLTPGTTYYFEVKSIDPSSGKSLSKYGETMAATTLTEGVSELKPVALSATSATDSLHLSWSDRGPGVRYLVRYTTKKSLKVLRWKKKTFDAAGGELTGLKKKTKYYYRVRVLGADGAAVSKYSELASGKTRTATPSLRVLSYNVNKASNSSHPWEERRDAVVANILQQAPDVLGLQEAVPNKVIGADGVEVPQYQDLMDRLGSRYALAVRKGSSGTKLAYDTSRLSVVDAGTKALTTLGDKTRYAVWAIFKDQRSRKSFFALNTHLEPGSTAEEYNTARVTQAQEVLQLIEEKSDGLPVVVTSDLNSARTAKPNGPYLTLTEAGLVDPVNNVAASWTTGRDATAEHVVDLAYNSYNGYETRARRTSYPIGTHIDGIFTDPRIRVAEYRQVVSLDQSGNFVGTIPSDHNALVATIHLPR